MTNNTIQTPHEPPPMANEPAPPTVPDIHGWPAERVQALQRDAAQSLELPVFFRDKDFRLHIKQRVKTGERHRWFRDPEPVFDEREVVATIRPPEMAVIPAGSFLMGSPDGEAKRSGSEGPQHRVTIACPFAIGRHAVTFDDYDAFCVATGREKPRDLGWGRGQRPVIDVTWHDAVAYCDWLSRQTGQAYRLPSEAEWEYACRAGTATAFHFGATITTDQANFDGNHPYGAGAKGEYREQTVPVGSLPPNPWGLYEVHGNVWEWCADCWHFTYEGAPPNGAVSEQKDCQCRVLRGGSWLGGGQHLRSACRGLNEPDYRSHPSHGLRLARGGAVLRPWAVQGFPAMGADDLPTLGPGERLIDRTFGRSATVLAGPRLTRHGWHVLVRVQGTTIRLTPFTVQNWARRGPKDRSGPAS